MGKKEWLDLNVIFRHNSTLQVKYIFLDGVICSILGKLYYIGVVVRGTLLMIGELFGAESKSQVYGIIDTFIHENKEATSNIRKFMLTALNPV